MKFKHEIKNFSNMYVIKRVAWPSLSVKKLNVTSLKQQQTKRKAKCENAIDLISYFVSLYSSIYLEQS